MLLLFSCTWFSVKSQPWNDSLNLILNPSFEEYTECPHYDDLRRPRWEDINLRCKYWETGVVSEVAPYGPAGNVEYLVINELCGTSRRTIQGLADTADFNRSGIASIHNHRLISAKKINHQLGLDDRDLDFIQGNLKTPLIKGKKYYLSFFVKPYDPREPFIFKDSTSLLCPREVGVYFHPAGFKLDEGQVPYTPNAHFDYWNYKPQVKSPPQQSFTQMKKWQEISGSFTATGNEEQFLVGNFIPAAIAHRDTIEYVENPKGFRGVSFIFDDFTLVPYPDLGEDTCMKDGDSILLSIDNPGLPESEIDWSNGEKGASIYVQRPGTYWVRFRAGYTYIRDNIVVKSQNKEVHSSVFPKKLTVCDDSIELNLDIPTASNVSWSNGDSSLSSVFSESGDYWLRYTNQFGCDFVSEITIDFPDPTIHSNDSFLCFKPYAKRYFTHHTGDWNHLIWKSPSKFAQDGISYFGIGDSVLAGEGIVIIEAHKDGCMATDTFELIYDKRGFVDMRDFTTCANSDLRCRGWGVHGTSQKNVEFLWSTGSTDSILCIPKTDTYWVETKTDSGCVFRDTGFFKLVEYDLQDQIICKDSQLTIDLNKLADSLNGQLFNPRWFYEDEEQRELHREPRVVFDQEGTYIAKFVVRNNLMEPPMYCNNSDTFKLSYDSIVKALPSDTVICNQQVYHIPANELYDSLIWQDGPRNKPLKVNYPFGTYRALLYRNGCRQQDSIRIDADSLAYRLNQPEGIICADDSAWISVETNDSLRFKWSDLSETDSFYSPVDTMLRVLIWNNACGFRDSFIISSHEPVPPIAPTIDSAICKGDSVKFIIPQNTKAWQLDNQELDSIFWIGVFGQFNLVLHGECAIDSGILRIRDLHCNDDLYVPNAFTPNNDGINDQWMPVINKGRILSTQVYARNGQLIYRDETTHPFWNGTFKGGLLPTGAYIFLIQYENQIGEVEKRSGDVLLIY